MSAPMNMYTDENGNNPLPKRHSDSDIEYIRTDVIIKDVKQFLAEIHRVCDITDENGYRIELRDLQARFENFYKETKI